MAHMTSMGATCSDDGACSGGPRIVEYTATGSELDSGFDIPIGVTLAAATYHVGFFGLGGTGTGDVPWAWGFPDSGKTTSQFQVTFSGSALTNGAVYKFQIVEAS